MTIGALDAAMAYGRTALPTSQPSTAPIAGMPADMKVGSDGDFGSLISGMVTDAATSLKTAEQVGLQQVGGKGNLIDVVTAIGAAEQALDTVVAVRDRVVSAYGEIMRMQI